MGVEPKIGGKPPKSSILIGVSIRWSKYIGNERKMREVLVIFPIILDELFGICSHLFPVTHVNFRPFIGATGWVFGGGGPRWPPDCNRRHHFPQVVPSRRSQTPIVRGDLRELRRLGVRKKYSMDKNVEPFMLEIFPGGWGEKKIRQKLLLIIIYYHHHYCCSGKAWLLVWSLIKI